MSLLDKLREFIARKHAKFHGVNVKDYGDHYRTMTLAERVETLADAADEWEARNNEQLDYENSIVDLMKLTGQDFSLEHRRELAAEVGWNGNPEDTAAMNMFLYPIVLNRLEIVY